MWRSTDAPPSLPSSSASRIGRPDTSGCVTMRPRRPPSVMAAFHGRTYTSMSVRSAPPREVCEGGKEAGSWLAGRTGAHPVRLLTVHIGAVPVAASETVYMRAGGQGLRRCDDAQPSTRHAQATACLASHATLASPSMYVLGVSSGCEVGVPCCPAIMATPMAETRNGSWQQTGQAVVWRFPDWIRRIDVPRQTPPRSAQSEDR